MKLIIRYICESILFWTSFNLFNIMKSDYSLEKRYSEFIKDLDLFFYLIIMIIVIIILKLIS